MKKGVTALALLITLGSAPALTTDTPVVDLGILSAAEDRTVELTVFNDSTATETITSIQTSCGCTSCEIQGDKALLSGDKRTLRAIVKNKGVLGPRKIDIVLLTKENPTPLLVSLVGYSLSLEGIHVLKSYLDFGEIKENETKRKRFSVVGTKEALEDLSVETDHSSSVRAEIEKEVDGAGQGIFSRAIIVTITREKDSLPQKTFVAIKRKNAEAGKVALSWTPSVLQSVNQRTLAFGKVDRSSKIVREVPFSERVNPDEIEVEVVGDLDTFSFAASPDDPTKVSITASPAPDANGSETGKMIFRKKGSNEILLLVDWIGFFE